MAIGTYVQSLGLDIVDQNILDSGKMLEGQNPSKIGKPANARSELVLSKGQYRWIAQSRRLTPMRASPWKPARYLASLNSPLSF